MRNHAPFDFKAQQHEEVDEAEGPLGDDSGFAREARAAALLVHGARAELQGVPADALEALLDLSTSSQGSVS